MGKRTPKQTCWNIEPPLKFRMVGKAEKLYGGWSDNLWICDRNRPAGHSLSLEPLASQGIITFWSLFRLDKYMKSGKQFIWLPVQIWTELD